MQFQALPTGKTFYRCSRAMRERSRPTRPFTVQRKLIASMREGPGKFVASGSELHNLDEDLAEKNSIAAKHPEIVGRLKARIEKARQSFQNDRPLE